MKINYVYSNEFSKKFPNLKHGFFTRNGGVSQGCYSSLNCSNLHNDNIEKVNKNLQLCRNKIGANNLIIAKLQHSNKVRYINNDFIYNNEFYDAIVMNGANYPGVAICVTTADCVPIVLSNSNSDIIAIIHAGWQGAFNSIIFNTVAIMRQYCNDNISAVIGPCISKNNYDVALDFKKKFIKNNADNNKYFTCINDIKDKYLFDLRAYVQDDLIKSNIISIFNIDYDTFTEQNLFFSYRRSLKMHENNFGCFLSFIMYRGLEYENKI